MDTSEDQNGVSVLSIAEHLFLQCKGNGYKPLRVKKLQSSFDLLCEFFNVNSHACMTLIPLIYNSVMGRGSLEATDINKWLECPLSSMGTFHESLGVLMRAGIISKALARDDTPRYTLKQKVLTCLLKNKKIPSLISQEKSLHAFLDHLNNLLDSFETDEIEEGMFFSHADTILEDFSAVKELSAIRDIDLIPVDKYLFFLVAHECINNEKSGADVDEIMKRLCISPFRRRKITDGLLKKQHPLIQKKLLAFIGSSFISVEWMSLGDFANEIFHGPETGSKRNFSPTRGVLIKPDSVVEQQLFYNKKEKETLDQILNSMSSEGLTELFSAYKSKNQPESLTVLLQGGPGVGKTSSVYDLAKKTGRIVYRVEIDKIHDMYVGETEKNIAKIFSEYETLRSEQKLCPILLLNECDNLLKSRISKERSSIDQMANNLTTLMLEKMENFSGILFATINQIQFDEAFFRRFLFRIEIKNPLPETRLQILLHAFPGIDLRVASSISDRYRLTGANIGNIQRKYILLSNACKDRKIEDCLDDLCKEEVVVQHQRIVISGFQTNKISENSHLI